MESPAPSPHPPTRQTAPPQPRPDTTGRDAYNVISDTVVGPNLRWKDNLYQGLAILACIVVGAIIGASVTRDRLGGLLVGGIVGMIAGLFLSGIFLMIFRAVRHARGRHD